MRYPHPHTHTHTHTMEPDPVAFTKISFAMRYEDLQHNRRCVSAQSSQQTHIYVLCIFIGMHPINHA